MLGILLGVSVLSVGRCYFNSMSLVLINYYFECKFKVKMYVVNLNHMNIKYEKMKIKIVTSVKILYKTIIFYFTIKNNSNFYET